jgi:hypothetical protein
LLTSHILNGLCIFQLKKKLNAEVRLDRAKNNVKIDELKIANEDSEKIVISRLAQG